MTLNKEREVTKMCDETRNDSLCEMSEDKAPDYKAMLKGIVAEDDGIEIIIDGTQDELIVLITAMVHYYAEKFETGVAKTLLIINEGVETIKNSNEVQYPGDGV